MSSIFQQTPYNFKALPTNYGTLSIQNNGRAFTEITPISSKGEENTIVPSGITARIMIPGGYRIFKLSDDSIRPINI